MLTNIYNIVLINKMISKALHNIKEVKNPIAMQLGFFMLIYESVQEKHLFPKTNILN